MSAGDLADFLTQLREAASEVAVFIEGMSKAEFLADSRTQKAVVLNLMIIGETVSRLRQKHRSFLELHPDVSWQQMTGMRNRIAHGYFDIDYEIVWETTKHSLPDLVNRLDRIGLP